MRNQLMVGMMRSKRCAPSEVRARQCRGLTEKGEHLCCWFAQDKTASPYLPGHGGERARYLTLRDPFGAHRGNAAVQHGGHPRTVWAAPMSAHARPMSSLAGLKRQASRITPCGTRRHPGLPAHGRLARVQTFGFTADPRMTRATRTCGHGEEESCPVHPGEGG